MTIRKVPKFSERGSLKDLAHPENIVKEEPLTASELRFKRLYAFAQEQRDVTLQQALGVITTDYISDKNALPLSIYRLRQMVEEIKSKNSSIAELEAQYSSRLKDTLSSATIDFLSARKNIKTASRKLFIFKRVSEL